MWNLRTSHHQVLENSQSLNVTYSQPIPPSSEIQMCQRKKLVLCCRWCIREILKKSEAWSNLENIPAMIQPRTDLSHCHQEKIPRHITWAICMCASVIFHLLGLAGQIMHSLFIFLIKVFISMKQLSAVTKLTKKVLLIISKLVISHSSYPKVNYICFLRCPFKIQKTQKSQLNTATAKLQNCAALQ